MKPRGVRKESKVGKKTTKKMEFSKEEGVVQEPTKREKDYHDRSSKRKRHSWKETRGDRTFIKNKKKVSLIGENGRKSRN